eukprot:Nk52_evm13s281 gene=Nk52_evmTU13s281
MGNGVTRQKHCISCRGALSRQAQQSGRICERCIFLRRMRVSLLDNSQQGMSRDTRDEPIQLLIDYAIAAQARLIQSDLESATSSSERYSIASADCRSSLPTFTTDEEWLKKMELEGATECVICSEDYNAKQSVTSLPCGHRYHKGCIMPWLVKSNSCPCCRADVDKCPTVVRKQCLTIPIPIMTSMIPTRHRSLSGDSTNRDMALGNSGIWSSSVTLQ